LPADFNQHEIKWVIGQCDFFLGSRMHACIAALSQSVPAVCLAYSRKFIGVMESIGCGEVTVDLCALDRDAVMRAVRANFADRARIGNALRERIAEVQRGVRKLFSPENLRGLGVDLSAPRDAEPALSRAASLAATGSLEK
jgi:polysaccharide pyruvyl transferase WcaK-like protein